MRERLRKCFGRPPDPIETQAEMIQDEDYGGRAKKRRCNDATMHGGVGDAMSTIGIIPPIHQDVYSHLAYIKMVERKKEMIDREENDGTTSSPRETPKNLYFDRRALANL